MEDIQCRLAMPSRYGIIERKRARERGLTLTHIKAPELAPMPEKMMATNALKPDVFQDFPLKEKTVLSHNVAM